MLRTSSFHKRLAFAAAAIAGLTSAADCGAKESAAAPLMDPPCSAAAGTADGKLPPNIGAIEVIVEDIFDNSDPRENHRMYRLANALHYTTREQTIRRQLIFKEGDRYDARVLEETSRMLRTRRYLYDAWIQPGACHPENNTVDVVVRVRDVWSLNPGISFGRKGGANSSRVEFEDENFLGRGKFLSLSRGQTVDRTSTLFSYEDPNLLSSRWRALGSFSNNSDGRARELLLERPFYSLDTRWSVGVDGSSLAQLTPRYALGKRIDAFDESTDRVSLYGGWSKGRENGWTQRWLAGVRMDRSEFVAAADTPLLAPLPAERRWTYPWIGFELIEDDFATTHNQDRLNRTEDLHFGRQLHAELGFAASGFGSTGSAALFSLHASSGYRLGGSDDHSLFLLAEGAGRIEGASLRDSIFSAEARYYHRQSPHRLFFASIEAARSFDLDLDHQLLLGGDSGLRGYPLRYQSGDVRLLTTVEQRFYTDWYPFRLFHVGAAVFADVGRTWGNDLFGTASAGWLSDVGFGLRLGSARSSRGTVLHLDVALPLTGPAAGGTPQFLVQTKKSF